MGRHSRSAAVPAAAAYAEDTAGRHRGGARRKKRVATPVKTGLLGVSAAMAVGAVAVASGLLPGGGGDQYTVGGGPTGEQVRTEGAPELQQQGGASAQPTDLPSGSASSPARARTPRTSASPSPKKPSATPSEQKRTKAPVAPPKAEKTKAPVTKAPAPPARPTTKAAENDSQAPAAPSSAATAVLTLVNQERAKVGCSPLRADASLAGLAQDFSDDMAARGFFDHTDPDGKTPWDRADQAGVQNLGGENIARGQADAAAVMDSWMNSEGHRANILNCDYTRLGVGIHTGSGGPWWTQDFGF